MILTSDSAFFERIRAKETKRYFDECYNFISSFEIPKDKIVYSIQDLL